MKVSAGARTAEEIMAGPLTGDQIGPASGEPLEFIADNWISCAANGVPLTTSNTSFFKEETYRVQVDCEGGLGLILAEMWADETGTGRGMVLVEEVVEGSNAAKAAGIAVGDTIVGVYGDGGLALGVDTEGRDWDTTVGALTSQEGSQLTLSMKRLTRRGRINVSVTNANGVDLGTFSCASGANLRMEFLRRQLPQDEIYDASTMRFDAIGNSNSNCGGEGSCGTCLVAVTEGFDLLGPPARIESMALKKQGRPVRWRWSCRTVLGDGTKSGDVSVQLQPQRAFKDEQEKTEGLGV